MGLASSRAAAALGGAAARLDASPVDQSGVFSMKSMHPSPVESATARVARMRRIAARAENDCAATGGRPDLLLRAALHHHAAGDLDIARAQAEALLARADDDPDYAPRWLVQQTRDLVARLDGLDDGQPAAG